MATAAELKSGTVQQVDEATKIEGGPVKDGDLVHFKTVDKGGKTCATWIHVAKLDKPKAS